MSRCVKCGHSPDFDSCPHCGYPAQVTTQDEHGDLIMFCCRKPAGPKAETPKGVK